MSNRWSPPIFRVAPAKSGKQFDLSMVVSVSAIVIDLMSLANAGVLMSTHRHARRSP